jgi:sortase A
MDSLAQTPVTETASKPRGKKLRRRLGTSLMVVGLVVVAWSFVVWQWNDPFTSLYTRWQQGRLATELEQISKEERARPLPPIETKEDAERLVRQDAQAFRRRATEGSPIGRIAVPHLGLNMVVVDGTTTGTLKKGPGLHRQTFMPGQGELIYIAGHRTTYRAPFARIDRLKPGDRVSLTMPYGKFEYVVTRHTIVDDEDLSVLRTHHREVLALQACHPRFFATERYIVWADLTRVVARDGTVIDVPRRA